MDTEIIQNLRVIQLRSYFYYYASNPPFTPSSRINSHKAYRIINNIYPKIIHKITYDNFQNITLCDLLNPDYNFPIDQEIKVGIKKKEILQDTNDIVNGRSNNQELDFYLKLIECVYYRCSAENREYNDLFDNIMYQLGRNHISTLNNNIEYTEYNDQSYNLILNLYNRVNNTRSWNQIIDYVGDMPRFEVHTYETYLNIRGVNPIDRRQRVHYLG